MKNATKLVWLLMLFASSIVFVFGQTNTKMNLEQKIAYDNSIVVEQGRSLDRGVTTPQTDGAKALLLDEAFTTGIPGSWTQNVYSGTGIWQWSGTIGGSYGVPPNSDGLYATADSDANSSWVYDVGLFTPSMDMTGGVAVTIDVDRNFQDIGGNDIAAVRVYSGGTAPGNLEVTLWQQSFDDQYAGVHASYLIDATVYADPSDVYVEFYYSTAGGTYQWNFAIDNVYIFLLEVPGDLYGYVFNGGGLTIANATVGVPAMPLYTTTGPDGYYEMFGVDAGNQEVAAGKAGYNTITHTVPIPSGGTIQQDFVLTSPTMIISPTFHTYTLNPEEY
ncbi:MAG: carboxypeptidase regulatory-like domain-containing protein, partial [Bacteroidales bacterium]|nr:carboxypeptidase regulatory-like domain-containing protein [Bacteroidales bacterium]